MLSITRVNTVSHLLHDSFPIIVALGSAFLLAVGIKTFLGLTFGGMFLALAGYLLPRDRRRSSASIEAGPVKVKWEGPTAIAFLIVAVLLVVYAMVVFFYSREII